MTDTPTDTPNPEKPAEADRIAKVIARAGLASRREAERMIVEGRVTVNGAKIASPALDVLPSDRITVDGKPLEAPQETRLWLYYKPVGLVTSEADEKGRQTVFDALPRDLPRVMSVGRLDLNSEGLLLLTNDGELKRRLELPATGWLRRYRVRVNGQPNDLTFAPLRRGATIDGEDFAPMEIKLDSQQGANAWLTVGIREGRNREIRRAMAHVGLQVNRLIRIGYGPFKLTGLEANEVREIRRRVLRDQLGGLLTGEAEETDRAPRDRAPRREDGDRKPFARREGDARKPFARREDGDRKPFVRREDGERKPFERRDGERGGKPFARRDGDRKPFARSEDGGDRMRKPRHGAESGARDFPRGERGGKPFTRREDGDRKPFARREGDERKPFERRDGDRKPFARRDGDAQAERRKPFVKRGDAARGPRNEDARPDRDFAAKGGRPRGGFKPGGKPGAGKPGAAKPGGGFARGPRSGKPGGTAGARPGPRGPKGPRPPKG